MNHLARKNDLLLKAAEAVASAAISGRIIFRATLAS
jgi:hypothetical protein